MQLGKKVFVVEGGACDALAKVGDRFRDGSHARFVFGRKKKWAQEWTVNTVAKRKPGFAHALEKIFGEGGHAQQSGFQNRVPFFRRGRRQSRWCWRAGHFSTILITISVKHRQPERQRSFARR